MSVSFHLFCSILFARNHSHIKWINVLNKLHTTWILVLDNSAARCADWNYKIEQRFLRKVIYRSNTGKQINMYMYVFKFIPYILLTPHQFSLTKLLQSANFMFNPPSQKLNPIILYTFFLFIVFFKLQLTHEILVLQCFIIQN